MPSGQSSPVHSELAEPKEGDSVNEGVLGFLQEITYNFFRDYQDMGK